MQLNVVRKNIRSIFVVISLYAALILSNSCLDSIIDHVYFPWYFRYALVHVLLTKSKIAACACVHNYLCGWGS